MQNRDEYPDYAALYEAHGSHCINKDGSITFLYCPSESDRSINQKVELDCPDLYEWLLNDAGELKEFTKDPNSNMYFLRIDNVPPDIFAAYRIKVDEIVIPPPTNQKPLLTVHHLDLGTPPVSIDHEETAYIKLGAAEIPQSFNLALPTTLQGSVEPRRFKSSDQLERDTWVYNPMNFNKIKPPKEKKVIFMLDGKDFCEKLTPYIDAQGEPFSNTAIVFIDPASYLTPDPPGRVREDYFSTDEFSKMLSEELLPQYCAELGVKNKDNVILAAHSLAAYPMLKVAESHPDQIGGLFLFSPALNQNKKPLSEQPNPKLKRLPIFMQIGQLEDAKPPGVHQNPETKDMQDETRLNANIEFHQFLVTHEYNVESSLRIHPYGHDSQHVFEGMVQGMEFYQRRLEAKSDDAVVTPTEPMPKRKAHFINGTPPRMDEIESLKVLTADELAKGDRILDISGPSPHLPEDAQPDLLLIVGKSDVLEKQDQAKQQIRVHIPPDMDDESMSKLIGLLQKNKNGSIDRERTTISGEGLGAITAMRMALAHPNIIGHADLLTLPESEAKACLHGVAITHDPTLPKVSFTVTNGPPIVINALTTLMHPVKSKDTHSVASAVAEVPSMVATEPMQQNGVDITPRLTPYSR